MFVELGKTPAKDPTNNQNITFIFSLQFFQILCELRHSTNISAPTHLFLFCCCFFFIYCAPKYEQFIYWKFFERRTSHRFLSLLFLLGCYCEHKRAHTRDCIKRMAVKLKSRMKWMLKCRAIHPSTHWIIALNFFFDRYIRLTQKNYYDQDTQRIKRKRERERGKNTQVNKIEQGKRWFIILRTKMGKIYRKRMFDYISNVYTGDNSI